MSPEPDPQDPLGIGKLLGGELMAQLQKLMSWNGGPVNWDLATEVARASLQDDPAPTAEQAAEVADAGRLADHWLDAVTTLPAGGAEPAAWSRRQWLDETLASWRELVEPVAGRVTEGLRGALEQTLAGESLPPELSSMMSGLGPNPFGPIMQQVGGFVFGAQVGQALGMLAGEVLSSTEVGIPLGRSALLPTNVAAFSEGLEVPAEEVRLYLALREAAHHRLFVHVPWLRAHLYDAVDAFGRGIEVDPQTLERAVGSFDPSDPAAVQEALGSGLFEIPNTPAQQAALDRLETALALVEGWVDAVVDEAARTRLANVDALRETVRRRRASGGPAEQTFATLVGLQLRPRRLREASTLWGRINQVRGPEGRDALWTHPDLLPGPSELDDPLGWGSEEGVDWDAALQALDPDEPDTSGQDAPDEA